MAHAARSLIAVIGGFVASAVVLMLLGMAKGALLDSGPSAGGPPQPLSGLDFAVELVLYSGMGLAGGIVAARLAPSRPERHAVALALIFLVLAVNDQRHPLQMTHRIQVAAASLVGIICCLLAARLAAAPRPGRSATAYPASSR